MFPRTIGVFGAETIRIGLFNDFLLKTCLIRVVQGEYQLKTKENTSYRLTSNQSVYLSLVNNSLSVAIDGSKFIVTTGIELSQTKGSGVLEYKSVLPDLPARQYEGNAEAYPDFNRLQVINHIDFDLYLAGVVESEAGSWSKKEFYKAQAIICRTYAYMNLSKHAGEGFHMCDGTHCQAYKSMCNKAQIIREAVAETHGQIISDQSGKPIIATFHSNSGGSTEASENVWMSPLPYLRPVNDPHALNGRNARWEKTIPLTGWRNYLLLNGCTEALALPVKALEVTQNTRKTTYEVGNFSISFRRLREDWQLKSTFFDIRVTGDQITLIGRGYGHGVGFSQEGAMQMALNGFTFADMIYYYYTDVQITERPFKGDTVPFNQP